MLAKLIPINWHPGLSIFASEPFLKAVGDEYGWMGGFDGNGELKCILPYTIVHKSIFHLARFRVETIPVDKDLEIEEEKRFLNNAVKLLKSIGADMIIPATTNTIFQTYPDGAIAAPYGSYIIDLTQPEDDIFGNFSSSHRRKVRLAKKKGVKIVGGLEYLETAYRLVRDTFARSKQGFMSIKRFRRYVVGLGENVKIFVAEYDNHPQGCLVIPFSEYSAYYVYGGSSPSPVVGANNLLHWTAMQEFKRLGVKRYDFVGVRINPDKGSKQEGLKMFKERFGGELHQGYMWKYPINRVKFSVYNLAVRLLRGGDIVDNEGRKINNTIH